MQRLAKDVVMANCDVKDEDVSRDFFSNVHIEIHHGESKRRGPCTVRHGPWYEQGERQKLFNLIHFRYWHRQELPFWLSSV